MASEGLEEQKILRKKEQVMCGSNKSFQEQNVAALVSVVVVDNMLQG